MAECPSGDGGIATTHDSFFGGRLTIWQPALGHRCGTDAVLLAAAVPRDFAGLALDVGAGAGVVGLGIAVACPLARVRLIERDPLAASLAVRNIAENGLSERCQIESRDLFERGRLEPDEPADLVVTNPPFWRASHIRASPLAGRRAAHVFQDGETLSAWLDACLGSLSSRGTLIVIHASRAMPEILAGLGQRVGGVTVLPIHPHDGAPATRILVKGTKGSRAPFGIAAPLMLHRDGRFSPEAERLHRGDSHLTW